MKKELLNEKDRRFQLVGDIFQHANKIGTNKGNICFLLATMNDKKLTKFHKEFLIK